MSTSNYRIVRQREVTELTGLTVGSMHREIRAGRFPAPFKLSSNPKGRAVGWNRQDIEDWLALRATRAAG